MDKRRRELLEKLMTGMGELHRCFATTRDGSLAKLDLTRPQMELLFALKHEKKSTTDLAHQFSISSSAISQMVNQLVSKNLVERVEGADRRSSIVQLSEYGSKTFINLRHQFIAALSDRFSEIDDAELESLLHLTIKVSSHLKKETYGKN